MKLSGFDRAERGLEKRIAELVQRRAALKDEIKAANEALARLRTEREERRREAEANPQMLSPNGIESTSNVRMA